MDSNISNGGSKAGHAATSQMLTRSKLKQGNINNEREKETLQRPTEVSPLPRETSPQRALKKNGNWSTADLQRAMEAIEGGAKILAAARAVNIPVSSVREHLYGISKGRNRGRAGILSPEEENELTAFLLRMANAGNPLTPKELRLKVAELTQTRPTPFKHGIPGQGWLRWWKRRHPDVASRALRRPGPILIPCSDGEDHP